MLLFWTQVIQALAVNSSQLITVQMKFADAIATGVLNFANAQPNSHTANPYFRNASLTLSFSNTTTSISPVSMATSPTMLVTNAPDIEQLQSTNTSPYLPSQTDITIAVIPTINVTNNTTSSISSSGAIFTSGSPGRRSILSQLIESLWIMN